MRHFIGVGLDCVLNKERTVIAEILPERVSGEVR